jgi:hypothetical protein
MSVAGILSSSLFGASGSGALKNTKGNSSSVSQFQQQFEQLGQDLKSGNLITAQSDLATLQQTVPSQGGTRSTSTQGVSAVQAKNGQIQGENHDFRHGSTPLSLEPGVAPGSATSADALLFQQMSQALQAGNISAAQQAYSSIQMGGQLFAL